MYSKLQVQDHRFIKFVQVSLDPLRCLYFFKISLEVKSHNLYRMYVHVLIYINPE